MDYNQQAGKNFIWLSAAQVVVRILAVAFFVLMSYRIHEQGVGIYNFVGSFVPFWFLLVDLGAGNFLYREWTKGKSNPEDIARDYNVLFTIRCLLALVVLLPFLVINYYINRSILWSLALFFISMFFATIINLNDLYLQSNNQFKYTSIRQVIEKLVAVVAAGTLLLIHPRVEMIFIGILFSQIVSMLYYQWRRLLVSLKFLIDWPKALRIMRGGLPFMFIVLFGSIYGRIDMVMLRYLKGFNEVGWYGTAYKFLDISVIFPALLMSAVFPLLSRLYNDSALQEQYRQLYLKSLRIIFSVGVLLALFFISFAPLLIGRLFPPSFLPTVLALRILMIAQVLAFLSIFFSNLMIIQRREFKALKIIIVSAAINIALNFFLIPRFSLYGAAWATVLAEICNLYLLQHSVQWQRDGKSLMRMALLIAGNACLLLVLKYLGLLNNYFLGAALLLLNCGLLFGLRLLQKTDIALFLSPIKDKFGSWLPGFNREEI
jgi:O-antigen/teichoic acid export membrane protein